MLHGCRGASQIASLLYICTKGWKKLPLEWHRVVEALQQMAKTVLISVLSRDETMWRKIFILTNEYQAASYCLSLTDNVFM